MTLLSGSFGVDLGEFARTILWDSDEVDLDLVFFSSLSVLVLSFHILNE